MEEADWRARLARRLMRSAWRPMRWQRLVLFAAVALAWASFAIWTTWLKQDEAAVPPSLAARLFDLLYAPFTYTVPQADFALSHKLIWQEAAARIFGPLVPLLGLFWLLRQRVLVGLAQFLAGHGAKGHAVLYGEHGSADALAIASSDQGETIVLCDPGAIADEDRMARLGHAGVIVWAAGPEPLAAAGGITVWQASDADNLARALTLRGDPALGERDLLFAQQSPDMHRALLQAPDLARDGRVRLRPVSIDGEALRRGLGGSGPLELALARGQARVTLALWGAGGAVPWAAELALRQFWSVQLGAPQVVLVRDAAGLSEGFDGLAQFDRFAGAAFDPADRPAWRLAPRDAAMADDGVTMHLIDTGDDDATIALCFSLAAGLRQASANPAPVRAVLRGQSGIASLFATQSLAFLPPIMPGSQLSVAALQERELDAEAARIHLAYDRAFGGGTAPASGRWQDLPETYVAANRAAADHAAIKRWDARASGLAAAPLIEALAKVEHNRWCAERLLNGWAPAGDGRRDNDRRLHPDLRPWAELDEAVRLKDREQVRTVIAPRGNFAIA